MKQYLTLLAFFFFCILNAQQSDFKHINFDKADSISHSLENHRLNNLPLLAYKLTSNLETQVEKFRAIYIWVCSNIESDYIFGEKTIRKRKKFKNDSISFYNWNNDVQASVFKRLLKDKKTICSGYAYLIKELSSLVDIPCEIINGYSRTVNTNVSKIDIPNHSWNTVKLNNKWYFIDATLASGYFYINENKFIKNYNDGYFLTEPELFSKSHFPLDEKWLLLKDKLTINKFVNAPLVYGSSYKYRVIPVSPQKLVTTISEGEKVDFSLKISNESKIDEVYLIISGGFRNERIKVSSKDFENGFLNFKYRFVKKGNYDVHIEMNKDIVVSYTVEVEKFKKEVSHSS